MSDIRATGESPAAPAATGGQALNIALWVGQILFAALFAFAGVVKLVGLQVEVDAFAQIGLGQWFRYLTGVLELAGAIGLLIPRLSGLAAIGLVGVMVGAAITHLTVLPPAAAALFAAFIGVMLGLIAWGRWSHTKALLAQFRP